MESQNVLRPWNVFVPHLILSEPSGYLIGRVYLCSRMLCVHGILRKARTWPTGVNVVGYWKLTAADRQEQNGHLKHQGDIGIILRKCGAGAMIECGLEIKSSTGSFIVCPVVCIFFNPREIESSYILLHNTWNRHSKTRNDSLCQPSKLNVSEHIIGSLIKDVQEQQKHFRSDADVKSLYRSYPPSSSWLPELFTQLFIAIPLCLMWIVYYTELLLKLGMRRLRTCCVPLPKPVQTSSVVRHLQDKSACYRSVLLLDKKDRFNMFVLYNCCGQMLLDACLGMVVTAMFIYNGLFNETSLYILDWADDIAKELITLIQWLMGSPAGLKLNAQLTKFLGHFFIYHIYLWTGYLNLLRSVMPYIIWTCSVAGVFGLTTQLCLISDVLSMLTMHIYCFYVYAAKIFSLQVYVMGSLWRLFRGKKWNVLRSRVDSASYNIDQLFFGTLLFTILLFLLPTTALYYAVFTILRLIVLTCQGLLSRLVTVVRSTPIFSILLRVMAPELVAGGAAFKISHIPEDENCLILIFQTCQIPIHELMQLSAPTFSPRPHSTHTWKQFIVYLVTGKLIYPWIEPVSQDKDKKE